MAKKRFEDVEQGFLDLLSSHQKLINKVLRIYAFNPEDRRELFQEIVYQLWRSYGSFKAESKVSTWLYRIALNTAITSLRDRKKRPEQTDLSAEIIISLRSHESADKSEQLQQLYSAIKSLGEVDRALVMLYLEDLSYKEIANVMGLTEDNVGVKLSRIKTKLRVSIEQAQ